MKNLIKIAFVFLCFLAAGSIQTFAQCATVEIINNLAADDINVTIRDNCSGAVSNTTPISSGGGSTILTMPSALCAMQAGDLQIITNNAGCQGMHPICPPTFPQPCSICAGALSVDVQTVPIAGGGCKYVITIN